LLRKGRIFFLLAFILILCLVGVGLRDSKHEDPLQTRLAEFAARGEKVDLEVIEMSQPLTERVVFPLARKLGEMALRFTPQNAIHQTARKLELAGSPRGLDPTLFWALRI
jgi:tight adherence protein C